jgi:hypothetical protein
MARCELHTGLAAVVESVVEVCIWTPIAVLARAPSGAVLCVNCFCSGVCIRDLEASQPGPSTCVSLRRQVPARCGSLLLVFEGWDPCWSTKSKVRRHKQKVVAKIHGKRSNLYMRQHPSLKAALKVGVK